MSWLGNLRNNPWHPRWYTSRESTPSMMTRALAQGSPILYIEVRKWSDLLVISPLDANTLAKVVNGICDNLLTSVSSLGYGWDHWWREKINCSSAMNSAMWNHPITAKQIWILEEWGVKDDEEGNGWFEMLRPQERLLICGDMGIGAMCEWQTIVALIEKRLGF